jgi:membrane-associated phospholipid phosphatase
VNQRTSFLHGLAWLISVIFHPVLLYTWMVFLITVYFSDLLVPIAPSGYKNLILVTFVSSAFIPVLIVGLWIVLVKKRTKLYDLLLSKKEDRQMPIIFLAVYYAGLAYVLFLGLNNVLYIVLVSLIGIVLLLGSINLFWKISNHAAGMGTAMGILLVLNLSNIQPDLLIPVLVISVVSGLVISSRLFLNAHKPKEVYVGYLLGLITSVIVLSSFYFFQ